MGVRQRFSEFLTAARKVGRRKQAPHRDTDLYPRMLNIGQSSRQKAQMKATPPNLRFFSRSPYPRRAINIIKHAICSMDWEIGPKKGIKLNSELKRQMEIASICFNHPNKTDSFHTLLGHGIEDYLVCGAGVYEQQLSGDEVRPLWLWPVDATSINIYSQWTGNNPSEPRYKQSIGYSNVGMYEGTDLLNDEIIYIKDNGSTENPYGYGCLEIVFNAVNRLLGVEEYAGNLASNAQPSQMLFMKGYSDENIRAFRNYWTNDIEGQGKIPVTGTADTNADIKGIALHGGDDKSLYLEYQTFLIREIATAFGLSPQNFSIERDVNRNTAEVAEDKDYDTTINPIARHFASHLTRDALHQKLGFYNLEFRFVGIDREDEESTAKIFETYYKSNVITPNEHREKLGLPPMDSQWGDLTFADTQIALMAARGIKEMEDKELPKVSPPKEDKGDDE